MQFDMTSMHTGFERAAALHPKHRSALLKARANLSGLVSTTDTTALTGSNSNIVRSDFVGSLRDLKDVRVVSTDKSYEAFEARLGGVVGINPEDAFQLAEAILIVLDEFGHVFDPDMWRMFTMDTLQEMVGDRYALEVSMALRVPSDHPFLLESLQTRKPAADDTRRKCILKLQTVSLTDVSWSLLEVADVAFLLGDSDAGKLWTFEGNARRLLDARQEARDKAQGMDHTADALRYLQRPQQAQMQQMQQHANAMFSRQLQQYAAGNIAQHPLQIQPQQPPLQRTAPPQPVLTTGAIAHETMEKLMQNGHTVESAIEVIKKLGIL